MYAFAINLQGEECLLSLTSWLSLSPSALRSFIVYFAISSSCWAWASHQLLFQTEVGGFLSCAVSPPRQMSALQHPGRVSTYQGKSTCHETWATLQKRTTHCQWYNTTCSVLSHWIIFSFNSCSFTPYPPRLFLLDPPEKRKMKDSLKWIILVLKYI